MSSTLHKVVQLKMTFCVLNHEILMRRGLFRPFARHFARNISNQESTPPMLIWPYIWSIASFTTPELKKEESRRMKGCGRREDKNDYTPLYSHFFHSSSLLLSPTYFFSIFTTKINAKPRTTLERKLRKNLMSSLPYFPLSNSRIF